MTDKIVRPTVQSFPRVHLIPIDFVTTFRLKMAALRTCLGLTSSWLVALLCVYGTSVAELNVSSALEAIRVSDDGTYFVRGPTAERFVVWGVNYDHDRDGRLLEDYWHDEWATVAQDFREIREL